MFFAERIVSIRPHDRVLEIGPGSTPHPRAEVLLERRFSPEEAQAQRGNLPEVILQKPVVYFDGGRFPFEDNSFDYIICSHVLEHVENVTSFVAEIMRVAGRGYFEFPTVYYEYLYNFNVHRNILSYTGGELLWMQKAELPFDAFLPVQRFFLQTLAAGYDDLIVELKPHFAIGFEWTRPLALRKASLAELCPTPGDFKFGPPPSQVPVPGKDLAAELGRRFKRRLGL